MKLSTPYANIYNRFLQKIKNDYVLSATYQSSITDFESLLLGWLKSAIPKFKKCQNNLTDRNDTSQQFNSTLTEEEEEILSGLTLYEWTTKEVNNILDIQGKLNDTDFKLYAEANNLRAKLVWQDNIKQENDRLIISYTNSDDNISKLG